MLLSGENADVRAILQMLREALDDAKAMVRATFTEFQTAGADRSAYLRWRLNREQEFQRQIQRRFEQLRNDLTTAMRDGLLRQSATQAAFGTYAIDQATPPSITVSTRAVTSILPEAVLATPWEAALYSDRIWAFSDDVMREIQQQIGQSVLLGEGVTKAMRRIQDLQVLDGNLPPAAAIERLVRTEMVRASDRARQLLFAENADLVEGETVIVTLDQRTCETCGPLDEKPLDSKEVQRHLARHDAEDRPPFHPNCRCTTAPALKSWGDLLGTEEAPEDLEDFADGERVIRDPTTGKSRIVPYMSFAEWVDLNGLIGLG